MSTVKNLDGKPASKEEIAAGLSNKDLFPFNASTIGIKNATVDQFRALITGETADMEDGLYRIDEFELPPKEFKPILETLPNLTGSYIDSMVLQVENQKLTDAIAFESSFHAVDYIHGTFNKDNAAEYAESWYRNYELEEPSGVPSAFEEKKDYEEIALQYQKDYARQHDKKPIMQIDLDFAQTMLKDKKYRENPAMVQEVIQKLSPQAVCNKDYGQKVSDKALSKIKSLSQGR